MTDTPQTIDDLLEKELHLLLYLAVHGHGVSEDITETKDWIKAHLHRLMLDVVGEDEPEDQDDYPFEYGKQYGRNELRAELRQRINDLFKEVNK